MPGMKVELHDKIVSVINGFKGNPTKCEEYLCETFDNVPKHTLGSIFGHAYRRKTKRKQPKILASAPKLYEKFEKLLLEGKQGIILQLSRELDFSPSFIARLILEQHYQRPDVVTLAGKTMITKMMKDTTLIEDCHLAYEVYLCLIFDDQYGTIADVTRTSLGQEYELRLERIARELQLTFRLESQLRSKGYDKTPDLKLDVPFAVNGFIVNWIESKALFADEEEHARYIREQYLSYWNRFGTGLVIYWFGFIETVEHQNDNKKFIVLDDFPKDITFMNPSCIKTTQL